MNEETAIQVRESLPSVAMMRANMALQKERRQLLIEYVRECMDPTRHFYNPKELGMGDDRLRLNQDGARNLLGLYEVYAGEPVIKEALDEDGHVTVDVRLPLVSHATGNVVGWGTGLCTTRESKYAYRWVGAKYVPTHLDKRTLRSREGRYGTMFRIPNEDLADQYHTVRQMARKRAEVAAVMELPGVTEIFAPEDEREEDVRRDRGAMLGVVSKVFNHIPSTVREKATTKLFGIKPGELSKASDADLERYASTLMDFEAAGIDWKSGTLLDDLAKVIDDRGEKAKDELFT